MAHDNNWPHGYVRKEMYEAASARIDALTDEVTRLRAERDAAREASVPGSAAIFARVEQERDRLRAVATDVLPLLAECDCIYSDRDEPLCPCRALWAAIQPGAQQTSDP